MRKKSFLALFLVLSIVVFVIIGTYFLIKAELSSEKRDRFLSPKESFLEKINEEFILKQDIKEIKKEIISDNVVVLKIILNNNEDLSEIEVPMTLKQERWEMMFELF